ncbi:MAG: quinolinate synthase NadA [Phycisphaerae bacterium]|nr:quinolinate synthase NadA [Phycisphaerae bacterium]
MQLQMPLPPKYTEADEDWLTEQVLHRKEQFGSALCILAHHYQVDAIVDLADFVGDSLKLSQQAASRRDARFIVFCGVHFMAESADVLSGPDQAVCLPHLAAGCAMADMADATDVSAAMEEVRRLAGCQVVPVTYVNSSAEVKAVTARAGGAKVFAIPDQHLGCNTAAAMGYGDDACVVYDPQKPEGGLTAEEVRRATFILWNGYCYVHQLFTPQHVRAARARHKDIQVIVHPECPREVVALSQASGSTEQIIQAVTAASSGSRWAVGTESHLVNRLARRCGDKFVRILSDRPSHCLMMARIDLPHLLWTLDSLAEGRIVNRVSVPSQIAADAKIALERMIATKAVKEATRTKTQ